MKPRALDLFCGAGGATRGLQLAGFHVTGVDINPQPNYCGDEFELDSAFAALRRLFESRHDFDFIWASPPCQAFTAYKRRPNHVAPRISLIPTVRSLLGAQRAPWVIENVVGAPLEHPVTLCGSMFGLDVRRHRLFEASFPLEQPKCRHETQTPRFAPATNRTNLRSTVEVGVWRIPLEVQQKAMGIDWMPLKELSQAIPPAYAKFIGDAAMKVIT